jgi:hypothetical protein
MTETSDRPPLRLLTFKPGQQQHAFERWVDVGQQISTMLQTIQTISPARREYIERGLMRAVLAELRRLHEENDPHEPGGTA